TLLAVFGVMASMHLGLALLALVVAPAMTLSSYLFGRPTKAAARDNREAQSLIHSHVQRTLSGMPVVQAFAQEDREHMAFRARASIDRVMEVLDAEPEVGDAPGARTLPPVAGHVRLDDITFGYEPGRPVLRGVSLEARPGEVVALVGATGAGKSTLVGLVPRF